MGFLSDIVLDGRGVLSRGVVRAAVPDSTAPGERITAMASERDAGPGVTEAPLPMSATALARDIPPQLRREVLPSRTPAQPTAGRERPSHAQRDSILPTNAARPLASEPAAYALGASAHGNVEIQNHAVAAGKSTSEAQQPQNTQSDDSGPNSPQRRLDGQPDAVVQGAPDVPAERTADLVGDVPSRSTEPRERFFGVHRDTDAPMTSLSVERHLAADAGPLDVSAQGATAVVDSATRSATATESHASPLPLALTDESVDEVTVNAVAVRLSSRHGHELMNERAEAHAKTLRDELEAASTVPSHQLEEPRVHIGQIDIVVGEPPPVQPRASHGYASSKQVASRRYLRRL